MLAGLLGFTAGTIPFIYLRCSIFKGKPKAVYFQSTTDKIKSKLSTWKGMVLSIMGRIQLVKSIIHGMLVYSFHVYMWPCHLLKLLDSWLKNFIWSGDILTKKVYTVSWKVLCQPWSLGGLDVKPYRLINESLMLKLAWKLNSSDSQWSILCRHRFLCNGKLSHSYVKSSVWAGIKMHVHTVLLHSKWIVGSGNVINMWTDNWLGERLVDLLPIDHVLHDGFNAKVEDLIVASGWNIPATLNLPTHVLDLVHALVLPVSHLPDTFAWLHSSDGNLTSKQAFSFLKLTALSLDWSQLIWRTSIPPAHSFIFWRLFHGKMLTEENLRARGCVIVSICCYCLKTDETSDQLFFRCLFAIRLWTWLGSKLNCNFDTSSVVSLLSCIPIACSSQVSDIFIAGIVHALHIIWISHNSSRFSSDVVTLHASQVRLHTSIVMSGNLSIGKCLPVDRPFFYSFSVSAHHRQTSDIILVLWKAPSLPWLKVNTDGSVIGNHAACGGLFRDHLGTLLGAFTCNIGTDTVFNSKVMGYIIALEFAAEKGWNHIWLESDSTSALMVFHNLSLVPILMRNRWHNAHHRGVQVISSHIFREGNCCSDKLASMGHAAHDTIWLTTLPPALNYDFFRDKVGMPNYRFP